MYNVGVCIFTSHGHGQWRDEALHTVVYPIQQLAHENVIIPALSNA